MDAVELPLPAAILTKLMRSSGCGGGGGGGFTKVELLASQTERSSFHPQKGNNCNANGSIPAFWNKISDADLSSLGKEEASIDHETGNIQGSFDMTSISQAKQSQQKSGKLARSNGTCSKRSRVAHMEASLNATGSVDMNVSPRELGSSYPGKCNVSVTEKMQISKQKTVSVKRREKRNSKISKSKSDSFSVKAGLSSFSSAAVGNSIFGVYDSKQDICDVTKHVDKFSLSELLDGSHKCPQSVKKTENLNANVLHSVREACSVLQLQKINHSQNLHVADNKRDTVDPSSFNKADDSCSSLEFPSFAPKDIMDRLALSPHNDLDLLLLDKTKQASKANLDPRSIKPVHSRIGLPTFPFSHISGGHFKVNHDVVKLTPSNKSTCQGRWIKMRNSTISLAQTTTFLADFKSLKYDQSLVPLISQQPGPTENEKTPLPSVNNMTFEKAAMPSGAHMMDSNIPDGPSPGILAAAQTLCQIATHFREPDQNAIIRWPKKPSQKSVRATKLKSDELLEKALFTIPISTPVGPANFENSSDVTMTQTTKRLNKPEAKHHNNGPMKRPFVTQTPTRLSNKPSKLRKLVPMEWRGLTDKRKDPPLM